MRGTNNKCPARESGQGQSPLYIKGANVPPSLGDDFPARQDPLARDGVTRILLSEAASRHLDATGAECFRIVCKAHLPDRPDRWVVILAPCPLDVARQAEGVLLGTHTAKRTRKPATARTATATAPPPGGTVPPCPAAATPAQPASRYSQPQAGSDAPHGPTGTLRGVGNFFGGMPPTPLRPPPLHPRTSKSKSPLETTNQQ